MPKQPILKLESIVKKFDQFTALHSIDLEISEGEFLTIVGPSGSGKTTLIRLLVGMDEPTSGAIWLRDKRIEQMPANKRPTCMVFQSLALFPHRSVGQNIEFPLKVRGEKPAKRKQRALELLELLHLPANYYDKNVTQCSGGERQRVALARALAFDPEILFFDEPLSALDYRLRKTLEKELKDLHKRTGKTFVYITHSLEEAMVMSDRIAIMKQGRFEQIDVADKIYTKPKSRFVAEFMGEVNLFEVEGDTNQCILSLDQQLSINCQSDALTQNIDMEEKVTLMVRPEFVRFLSVHQTADFMIEGVVQEEYALGSRMQYSIETKNGSIITVEKLLEDRFEGGREAKVVLGWDAERTHVIRA